MGGWKNLIINGWVRHNGGVHLKMGGGVILSKVILVPQEILNKTSTFWPNAPKILSKCISKLPWQNWHKIHFLLHFHVCSFSKNSFKRIISLCGVFIFWVSNCLKIGQVGQNLIGFYSFSLLWIINNYSNLNYSQSSVNVFC